MDIAFTTMWQDVPVSIFPMKPHLTTILGYFGRGNVKARDGSAKDYRSDPILTNMTVADYDEESLRYVCNIYEMDDVRMQKKSLGMARHASYEDIRPQSEVSRMPPST